MTRRSILTGLAVTAVSGAFVAAAFAASASDPKDAGPKLDLKRVSGSVNSGLVTAKVGVYGTVNPANLGGGLNKLVILFDSNENGTIDYRAKIRKSGAKLVAMLSGHGNQFEPLPVKRTGGTLSITFPADVVSKAGKTLRVAATSTYQAGAGQTKFVDRAPDTGWVNAG
jgi:hypothetical protein